MHEGDRYYMDSSGIRVHLYTQSQVEPLLDAAEQFLHWLEARA